MLIAEEASCLAALAAEEEQKIAAIQEMIDKTKNDIVALKKLVDTLKREMGNEDLPLVQVRKGSPSP